MDSADTIRKKIADHIDSFTRILSDKGYYRFNIGTTTYQDDQRDISSLEKLKQDLTRLIRSYYATKESSPAWKMEEKFSVTCFALWADPTHPLSRFAKCIFGVTYTNQGFQVKDVSIILGIDGMDVRPHDMIKSERELKIHRNDQIPSAQMVRRMMLRKVPHR